MSEKLFNDSWKFLLRDNGTELSDVLDSDGWHDVEIPHDWLIGDTANLYKSGDGWYKKSFFIGELSENNVYILRFDGVYMDSTVYINGVEAGGRHYGYSCFSIDITPYIRLGENDIFVRVRYISPNSRWYSGAGIFRDVVLRSADKTYVEENGVYISAKPDGEKWLVTIETDTSADCGIVHTVYSGNGKIAAKVSAKAFNGHSTAHFYAANPHLWDIDDPYLYSIKTDCVSDGKITDSVSDRFGFRTIEFNPQNGFFLNGKNRKIQGVCMHHDLGALGAAFNRAAMKRQLKILKSFGVNAVRTAHNMPARGLIELCSEMGILVDTECFDMWEEPKTEYDYARFFKDHWKEEIESWVKRDRNAPCVIMWSIGNEIVDTHKSERGTEVAEMLCDAVHEFDKYENAVCTFASNFLRWENTQKTADKIKLVGYNYTEDAYDAHHEAHPDWFIYGSETASTVRSRGIYHLPADTPILVHEDMQCSDFGNSVVGWGKFQEKALIEDRDRPYCGGQFVWTGFDYIGEPTPYSTKNSYFGIVDTAGFAKNSYYLYKAYWTKPETEPFVQILPYWDFNMGEMITVMTYSNLSKTELFFNGVSQGVHTVDFAHGNTLHCEWNIPYKRGVLIAKAYDENGNEAASHSISSFADAFSIEAVPDKYIINSDGRDIVFFEISVRDINGNCVENARNRINVTVNGPARLVGLDNGDSTDYDSYKGSSRRLFSGKLLAMVQSTFESGEVSVSFESEGLESKLVTISSLPCEKTQGVSVVDNYYPAVFEQYRPEKPLRKIELHTTQNELTPDRPSVGITARLYPENADYKDIEFKCIIPTGVSVGLSQLEKTENGVKVTAKGDGKYIIRACCNNGKDFPQIVSDITLTNTGFGSAVTIPYEFVSTSLFTKSNIPVNIVERGAASGFSARTVITFDNVDFGSCGPEKIDISCGLTGDRPAPVALWLGDPDNGGELISEYNFDVNGRWDGFEPQSFDIPANSKLKGVVSISFVIDRQIIFGGFSFREINKAYSKIRAVDNDAIYGDDYRVSGVRVADIGNNVVISFCGMNFGDGATALTISGRTSNITNGIQIRYNDDDGVQHTQIVNFAQSFDYTEQRFDIEKISGNRTVSFVFMPGSRFDFDWFRFE